MAGFYIHIPFCRTACNYCNFHFVVSKKQQKDFVRSLIIEIEIRKDYLIGETIDTIYFGGGTPSLLEISEIKDIIDAIYRNHSVGENPEITMEANPEDLTIEKIEAIRRSPINRLSIGVQSFFDEDLLYLGRPHTAAKAIHVINSCKSVGLTNLSIDLIYGIPGLTASKWLKNLATIKELAIPHFSAYCLTVEEKTPLHWAINKGRKTPIDEEMAIEDFLSLMEFAKENNYEHYEISNFCFNDAYSVHNSNYWKNKNYIGIGPSAHSFNGDSRQWNFANNTSYINSIATDKPYFEVEVLSVNQRYNEYIMTSLRTIWGIDLIYIQTKFGNTYLEGFIEDTKKYLHSGLLEALDGKIKLTDNGKLYTDKIASDLFVVN